MRQYVAGTLSQCNLRLRCVCPCGASLVIRVIEATWAWMSCIENKHVTARDEESKQGCLGAVKERNNGTTIKER